MPWKQDDMFDGDGEARRDEGMGRVYKNNKEWMAAAFLCLHKFLFPGWRGQPEDWRYFLIKEIGYPTKDKAWGPLTKEMLKRGMIRPTGRRLKMQSKKSNARKTDEYERPE